MNVHLLLLEPSGTALLDDLCLLHAAADVRAHELTADAEGADLILAVGEWVPKIEVLTRNPVVTRFRSKCAVYYDNDGVIPIVPGVYASAVEGLHSRLGIVKNCCYAVALGKMRNRGLDESGGAASQKRWLFSFKGGSTSLLRKRLFRTDFGRADVLVENMSAYRHWEDDEGNRLEWQRSYARTLRESHFALCPRGAGAGSIRFFEAMEMGVAPVLLSDHYLLPEGPAWESFLIKVPERRIRQLPEMLEERRGESAELGLRARQAWETWFSATSAFNNIVDAAWKTVQAAERKQGFLKATQGVTIARYRAFVAGRAMARGAALGAMRALGKDPARFGVSGPK